MVVSENLARLMPERPYHVIPSGINLDLFCPEPQEQARRRLGLDPDRRYVLFAGMADNPRKRFPLVKQSVDLLRQEIDVDLLVAAHVPHEQIPHYMNAADVLLLLSLHEGSPNVVKEALACNLPVISTDVGDVRQRIGSLPGCIVLSDDRPEAVASALKSVLANPQRVNGRPSVQDLDEKLLTNNVINVYLQSLIIK